MTDMDKEVARVDAIIAAGSVQIDSDGHDIIETETCGTCGRSWNAARISELTPPPSGRCPYEYAHNMDTRLVRVYDTVTEAYDVRVPVNATMDEVWDLFMEGDWEPHGHVERSVEDRDIEEIPA